MATDTRPCRSPRPDSNSPRATSRRSLAQATASISSQDWPDRSRQSATPCGSPSTLQARSASAVRPAAASSDTRSAARCRASMARPAVRAACSMPSARATARSIPSCRRVSSRTTPAYAAQTVYVATRSKCVPRLAKGTDAPAMRSRSRPSSAIRTWPEAAGAGSSRYRSRTLSSTLP